MTWRRETDISRKDVEGQSLDQLCGTPMDMGLFFKIAVAVATALGGLHRRNIVHKNITPHHIVVNHLTQEVTITDVSADSPLPSEYLTRKASGKIEHTLAYMSPEQTGRMNRLVDYRY